MSKRNIFTFVEKTYYSSSYIIEKGKQVAKVLVR